MAVEKTEQKKESNIYTEQELIHRFTLSSAQEESNYVQMKC